MNIANPPAGQPGNLKYWIIGGGIVIGIVVVAGIAIVGFLPTGVAAGSIAAGIHSSIGVVAAGSAFAIFQSLGTMPLVGFAIGVAGGAVGELFAGLAHRYAAPWFSRIFGAMEDAFWTVVEFAESLWLKIWEMLEDALDSVVEVAKSIWDKSFGEQGKSKTQ